MDDTAPPPPPLPAGTRGLLLIDVDGPLNPWDNKPCRRPDGYLSYRLGNDGGWYTGRDFRRHKGLWVWLNPGDGLRILDLAEDTKLAPVWATTWLHLANWFIGPAIGLPPLPVITFPETDLAPSPMAPMWRHDGGWKWPGTATYAQDLPLAWWDDELHNPTYEAAKQQFLRDRGDTPTLLCHVDPSTGLRDHHYDQVRTWADTLT